MFYWVMLRALLGALRHPLILVDWGLLAALSPTASARALPVKLESARPWKWFPLWLGDGLYGLWTE